MAAPKRHGAVVTLLVRTADFLGLLFPGALLVSIAICFYSFVVDPTPWRFALMCAVPYLLPLALYRLMTLVWPLREGRSLLEKGVWSPWFISYRLQLVYGYFPSLENALLAFPGVFNWWLRAWGSRVGKRVLWAATAQITDRGLMDIGNDVFFGGAVVFVPHVVRRKGDRGVLYVKRITVGDRSFIGAGSRMGPGTRIARDSVVPLLTDLYVNQRFPAEPCDEAVD